MGVIGSFGDVIFEVSHDKIRTFDNFVRSASARWDAHDIIGKKTKKEFNGSDVDQITFTMRFDVQYKMNPKKEMDRLLVMCRSGQAETLIVGVPLGVKKWVITSINQNWDVVDNEGKVLVGTADVTLEEYT